MVGYLLEVLFRRFFSAKKWVNPGFMKGPWLPLYGFGLCGMFLVAWLCVSFFPSSMPLYNPLGTLFGRGRVSGPTTYDLLPIGLIWLAMILLEFIAGIIFIKGFKVKLWDYSNMRGNILGILCPVFSFFWLVIAIAFYYGINPYLYEGASRMYEFMFNNEGIGLNFGFIFLLGIAYGIFFLDLVRSLGVFAKITRFAKDKGIVERYEEVKEKWSEELNKAKQRLPKAPSKPEIVKQEETKIRKGLARLIFIDPSKEENKEDNYDSSGRPKKD